MNENFVCDTHAYSSAMPISGRCLDCIAEDNAERRGHLLRIREQAESAARWRTRCQTPITEEGMHKRLTTCLYHFTARSRQYGWQHEQEDQPVTVEAIEALLESQGGMCNGCFTSFDEVHLTLDHITPVSYGGRHVIKNLQLLCQSCNTSKGDQHNADWLSDLRYRQVSRQLQEIAEEDSIVYH